MNPDPDCQNCGGDGVIEVDDYREATGHFTREEPCGCRDREPDCREPDDYGDDHDDRECSYRDARY